MDIYSVKKIFECDYENVTNEYLQKGWTLLKVDTIDVRGSRQLVYVLGWTHNESEKEYVRRINSQRF